MKYITVFLLVLMVSVTAQAQESFFGMTYDVSIPLGETENFISGTQWRGFGMEGRWYMNKNTSLGFSWDWNVFHGLESGTSELETGAVTGTQVRTINAFPFLLTGHYYLKGGSFTKPYFGLGIGTYLIKRKLDIGIFTLDDDNWHFGIAPEVGFMFPMDLGFNIHLKLRYNYAFKSGDVDAQSYFGINVGFASISLF